MKVETRKKIAMTLVTVLMCVALALFIGVVVFGVLLYPLWIAIETFGLCSLGVVCSWLLFGLSTAVLIIAVINNWMDGKPWDGRGVQ